MVLDEVMSEIHLPKLSVVQALLLYLQKSQPQAATAVAETPLRWSLLGFANSLATTLGLHLECRHWNIPDWEKRLRRRLWWAVFSESVWRSLLQGYPNPIHEDDWDVEELDQKDFTLDHSADGEGRDNIGQGTYDTPERVAVDFIYLTQLSCIASDTYWAF